jgi:hypothetical protein
MKVTLAGSIIYEAVPHFEWRPQSPPTHTVSSAVLQTDNEEEIKNASREADENNVH